MGRELKRVPLDFNWPLDKTWEGYLNPNRTSKDCLFCDHSGYGPEAKKIYEQWYGNAEFDAAEYGATPLQPDHPSIVAFAKRNVEDSPGGFYGRGEAAVRREALRLWEMWHKQWCHNLIQADVDALWEDERLRNFKEKPTADELNAAYMLGMGHDSINSWVCLDARLKREGIADKKLCTYCGGEGQIWPSPEARKLYEEWKEYDPPTGDGFQLWENTSEGSPQTPVFETLDGLCSWCEDYATTFADFKATKEEWKKMLEGDNVHHRKGDVVFI